jgi:hypothetical protein
MKKLRVLLFATLIAGSANAQFFQHVYGAQSQDTLQSGINTILPAGPQGHIMAGFTDRIQFYSPMVVRTDANGLPVFFNNYYKMTIAATGQQINAKARRVVQAPALGGRISVWGDYGLNPGGVSTNFFYMLLNPNGAVSGVPMSYSFPFPVVEARATSMCTSNINPNLVYVCGYIRIQPGSPRMPVTMGINAATGAMVWGFDYTVSGMDWYPTDMVESPYSSTGELALCGHFTRPGFPENGCFYRISETTPGTVIPSVVTYGTTTNPGGFNAIDIARNPYPAGNPGYVMGGYYNNPATGTDDSWAMKINFNGLTIDFSTLHDYTPLAGNDDYGNDIIERQNTVGNFEYYLGGYVKNGVFGGNDDLVYKLDFTGAAFPGISQFTYGGGGTERVMQLDKNDIAPAVGLSVFGNTANSFPLLGQNDFYLVKSYFNGVTACNYDLQPHNWMPGPGIIETWNAVNPDKMNPVKLAAQPFPMQDFEVCFNPGPIPGGDNSRHAAPATENAITAPGYFPNPVSHDNAVVTVTFGKAAVEGEATIELWNSLGQLCWSKQASVADGQTQLEVQLGNELSGGMYHLIVKQNGAVSNYRIVVQ